MILKVIIIFQNWLYTLILLIPKYNIKIVHLYMNCQSYPINQYILLKTENHSLINDEE